MFALLMYGVDAHASMYATMMHSDSGYLVTDPSGKASYAGYLTWDDHSTLAAAPARLRAVKKVEKKARPSPLQSLNGCLPFGCITNAGEGKGSY
jgi:hypothetical protein